LIAHFVSPSIQVPPKRWQAALVIGLPDIEGVDVPKLPEGTLPADPFGVLELFTSLPVVPLPVAPLREVLPLIV
jgi:hypothetical protein